MKENITKLENIEVIIHMSSYKTNTSIELHFLYIIISALYESYLVSYYKSIEEQYHYLKNPINQNERSSTNNNI